MPRRDARHSTPRAPTWRSRWLPVLLVVAILGAAGAAYRFDVDWLDADRGRTEPAEVAPPPGLDQPEVAAPSPVAGRLPAGLVPDEQAVRRALRPGLADRDLGRHVVAAVADLEGGAAVVSSGRGSFVPASTTKLLTATAALAVLGPGHRFRTTVVAGDQGRIVLVGGGDPLLAGRELTAAQQQAAYPERADIETLARRTARALAEMGRRRVRLGYDDSLFSGPTVSPHWEGDYVPTDVVTPITALWVDQGRAPDGGRVADPSRFAAERFAAALGEAGIRVRGAPREVTAPHGAPELAAVASAPVGQLVQRMLDVSDNEAAEVLAHHVGRAVTGEGSFAGGAEATISSLRDLGVAMRGVELYDGSGLSRDNRLTARALLEVLQLAADPDHPELREVLTGLPVAGFTGSLATRFEGGDPQGPGRVRAKTGTLTGVHGLAGIATGLEGNTMAFVLVADRVAVRDTLAARERLDRLAAELAGCRCAVR